jgi:hypothetical protein
MQVCFSCELRLDKIFTETVYNVINFLLDLPNIFFNATNCFNANRNLILSPRAKTLQIVYQMFYLSYCFVRLMLYCMFVIIITHGMQILFIKMMRVLAPCNCARKIMISFLSIHLLRNFNCIPLGIKIEIRSRYVHSHAHLLLHKKQLFT